MNIRKINPENETMRAPSKAYSQGIVIPIGNVELMFITGQLAQDRDGDVIAPGDVEEQTKIVFSRLRSILNEAGMGFDDVVKVQIFIKDISQSKLVSSIRDEMFKNSKPVSTLVEVSGFVKPDCMIEIEITAVKGH